MSVTNLNDPMNSTGVTDEQAQEIHGYFVKGLIFWAAVSAFAHLLVWNWLPWFPGAQ